MNLTPSDDLLAELETIYRDLHEHPELSMIWSTLRTIWAPSSSGLCRQRNPQSCSEFA